MTLPRIYLAGPDVFEPDARERYAKLSVLAEANGLQAIVPMDAEGEPARVDEAPAQAAQRIFLANIARLDAADGMVAMQIAPDAEAAMALLAERLQG